VSYLTSGQDHLVLEHILELGQLLDLLGEIGDLLEVLLASLKEEYKFLISFFKTGTLYELCTLTGFKIMKVVLEKDFKKLQKLKS
jgi:hypothetical protein